MSCQTFKMLQFTLCTLYRETLMGRFEILKKKTAHAGPRYNQTLFYCCSKPPIQHKYVTCIREVHNLLFFCCVVVTGIPRYRDFLETFFLQFGGYHILGKHEHNQFISTQRSPACSLFRKGQKGRKLVVCLKLISPPGTIKADGGWSAARSKGMRKRSFPSLLLKWGRRTIASEPTAVQAKCRFLSTSPERLRGLWGLGE